MNEPITEKDKQLIASLGYTWDDSISEYEAEDQYLEEGLKYNRND